MYCHRWNKYKCQNSNTRRWPARNLVMIQLYNGTTSHCGWDGTKSSSLHGKVDCKGKHVAILLVLKEGSRTQERWQRQWLGEICHAPRLAQSFDIQVDLRCCYCNNIWNSQNFPFVSPLPDPLRRYRRQRFNNFLTALVLRKRNRVQPNTHPPLWLWGWSCPPRWARLAIVCWYSGCHLA